MESAVLGQHACKHICSTCQGLGASEWSMYWQQAVQLCIIRSMLRFVHGVAQATVKLKQGFAAGAFIGPRAAERSSGAPCAHQVRW
jgi:hypothetical protein